MPSKADRCTKITMSFLSEDKSQSFCLSKIYPAGGMTEAEVLDHTTEIFNFTGIQLFHLEFSNTMSSQTKALK